MSAATEKQREDAIHRVPLHPPYRAPALDAVEEDGTLTLYETGAADWLVAGGWLRIDPAEAAIDMEGHQ